MKKLFTISISCMAISSFAQITNPYCDGTRYVDYVFTGSTKTAALQYGHNTTYCGAEQDMLLDIYQPTGDVATKRPVLFVNYGGSFIQGNRNDAATVDICKDFAKRGYVTVAIDYRLLAFSCALPIDSAKMLGVVVRAVGDQKAAIRYIREHSADYGIDTNFVFVSGISAGAILALHTAYIDNINEVPSYVSDIITENGGIEGNTSSNYQYNSSIQGVWSMSGGLHKAAWIDSNDAPLIAIHETADPTVPYGHGFANVSGQNLVTMDGGSLLHAQADANGQANVFFSISPSASHTAYLGKPAILDSLSNEAARLFESILCGTPRHNYTATLAPNYNPASIDSPNEQGYGFAVLTNPSTEDVTLKVENNGMSYQVQLIDQLGRVVYTTKNVIESQVSIPRNGLGLGVYSVSVKANDSGISTKRIVLY